MYLPSVSVKNEPDDIPPIPTLRESPGAKGESEVYEPPMHTQSRTSLLRSKVEEDIDDVLTSLCILFDGMTTANDSDSQSDESEPESPRAKGSNFEHYTFFFYGDHRYFYDSDHNVYLDDDYGLPSRIHTGRQPGFFYDQGFLEFEYITGLPIYFGIDGAPYSEQQGIRTQVPTFPGDTWDLMLSTIPSAPVLEDFQFDPTCGSALGFQDFLEQPPVTDGVHCDFTKTETNVCNPEPLRSSLQGQKSLPWSPVSTQSPIVPASSRASSESFEPLIFSPPEKVMTWKEETKVIQSRNTPAARLDRRRCKFCQKVFRRPSSLDDHLNVHTGDKPHMCPYEGCNTGFATNSNMKRHFNTHRVGPLDDYCRGAKNKSLTATYNAKAYHTQRFRLPGLGGSFS